MAGTVSWVAIEPQLGEQVVCQDLTGELSDLLLETRKETQRNAQSEDKVETCVGQSQTKIIDSRVLS